MRTFNILYNFRPKYTISVGNNPKSHLLVHTVAGRQNVAVRNDAAAAADLVVGI